MLKALIGIFGHPTRPQVDSQNTGRMPYARPIGVGTVSVQGQGGANNFRSLNPFNISSTNPAFVSFSGIAGTGSPDSLSTNPQTGPLINTSTSNIQLSEGAPNQIGVQF